MKALVPTLNLVLSLASTVAVFSPGVANAQEIEGEEISAYVAAGLSISNTGDADLDETSYPSAEVGLSKGPVSFGLVVGRESNDFSGDEELSDYWWEMKAAVSAPLGSLSAYGLLGVGNYFSTDRFFIEYGLGVSHSWDSISVFAQVSNWDGLWYVTPGLMYGF